MVHTAEAQELTLKERANLIAVSHEISPVLFTNLIESESQWNPDAYNEKTGDRGLLQISERWHPEVSDECAFDADCAMDWAAKRIKAGYSYEWVVANCYSYAQLFVGKLPKMAEIKPNGPPKVGGLVILQYGKVKHLAVITALTEKGIKVKEANFEPAKLTTRTILWSDSRIIGFYAPGSS